MFWEATVCPPGLTGCALQAPVVAQSGLWRQRAIGHLVFSVSCSPWWHS